MIIWGNQTSKIYPDLNLTEPHEPQSYLLRRLTEIEVYLIDETKVFENLPKRIKQFNTITSITDTDLIKLTFITAGVSIDAFGRSAVLHVGIALSGASLTFSLAATITKRSFKTRKTRSN